MKLKKLSSFIFIAISFMTLSSCDISSNNNKETSIDTTSDVISTNTEDITPSKDEEPIPTTEKETEETKTTYADEDVIVTFEADNDTIIEPITVKAGTIITPPSVSKDDKEYSYTLDGWYTRAKNGVKFDFNNPIVKDITLFAIWNKTPKTYTVRFFDGTNGNQINSQVVEGGKLATEPQLADKSGLKFDGWYISSNMKTPFSFDTPIVESLDIYAKYVNDSGYNSNLNITAYNGYIEGAFVEFEKITGVSDYSVSYKNLSDTNYTKLDSNLVRIGNSTVRADILGIIEGDYIIRVEANSQIQERTVSVSRDDRSGYAHFNYTSGIGAYNDNGTLKDNAVIVYVTDETKNSVTAKIGSKTYTGLVNIIKNANSEYPLDIRILDTIKTCQFNKITYTSAAKTAELVAEQKASLGGNAKGYSADQIISNKWNSYSNDEAKGITKLNGLNSSCSYSSGEFDTCWNDCSISNVSNVTVEGVGKDAGIFQWGFTWAKCNSIEIKNLTFSDYTEDACSFQTGGNGDVKAYGHYWVHNNTFNRGKNNWDLTYEQDKYAGDGATDYKQCSNITSSYNIFNTCKKTGLIGGSNSNLTMNVTFHHNYYNEVGSRLPLGRQANMHIYNNYYYACSVCQDIRANAFVLSESNYFENCGSPQLVTTDSTYSKTVIKSYNDKFIKSGTSQATIVTDRTASLDGLCKPDGSSDYTNFDTNSTLFYYDSKNNVSDVEILTNVEDVPSFVTSHAGAGTLTALEFEEDTTTYTVKFNTNGGTKVDDQVIKSGKRIVSVTTTKTNYIFDGWYTDSELKKPFDVTTKITSNLTLYAKWVEELTISFISDGGSSISDIKIAKGNSISSLPTPTKDGYKFDGWYLEESHKTKVSTSTVFNSNQTLYANWILKTNSTVLTFNTLTAGDITSTTTVGDLTINHKDGKTITVYECNKTIEDEQITRYIYLGGAGNFNQLSIQFEINSTSNITIYYAGNSGRYVSLNNSSGTVLTSTTTTTGAENVVSYTFSNIEAGTYSIASTNSGVYFYAIVIS